MSRSRKRRKKKRKEENRWSRQRELGEAMPRRADKPALAQSQWAGPADPIGRHIVTAVSRMLKAYRNQPNLVEEHFNQEEDTARGGYAHRQLFELVQNSADALAGSGGGRICVWLTPAYFYCADEGHAVTEAGVTALMFSHLSPKRGTEEIGRFGLGFKSVLGVSDAPEFFSRSGSFRFSRERAAQQIRPIVPDAAHSPVLRLPEAFDPVPEAKADRVLLELMGWATNIVRLPLQSNAHEALNRQIRDFPAEFLLFVKHVSSLDLLVGNQERRALALHRTPHCHILHDGGNPTRWVLASTQHALSRDAQSDSRNLDNATEVPIAWAAPMDRPNEPGRFWAFFPTMTSSLLAGILNAPWKTNEDRQNLLPGIYNDELIDATASMVAKVLPRLATPADPAQHLDALPRRVEAWDTEHSQRLQEQLHWNLQSYAIVPDQTGKLRRLKDLAFPPRHLTDAGQAARNALESWAVHNRKPSMWLHHSALNRNRMAAIERLWKAENNNFDLPRATIADWLVALVNNAETEADAIAASKAAIQTAFLLPPDTRGHNDLGTIVLTAEGQWVSPAPDAVFLGGGQAAVSEILVHPQLEADPNTLRALKGLGITRVSPETDFKEMALRILSAVPLDPLRQILVRSDSRQTVHHRDWIDFWQRSRHVSPSDAARIIQESSSDWHGRLHVHTVGGQWQTLHCALLPGSIVPDDGSRDRDVTIDVRFHAEDLSLLQQLGAVDAPTEERELSPEKLYWITIVQRALFIQRSCPSKPRSGKLNFDTCNTAGPLSVLELLSEEGKARYTWRLLALPATYKPWTMQHDTRRDTYQPMKIESPTVQELRQHGRISTDRGIRKLSDGIGNPPQDRAVYRELLSHPQSGLIRQVFKLHTETDSSMELFGEDDPVPLTDMWPGFRSHLLVAQTALQVVRCDRIRSTDDYIEPCERDCIVRDGFIYIVRREEEEQEVCLLMQALDLQFSDEQIEAILLRRTSADVQKARRQVRECATHEERLLTAVGEMELRQRLPRTLLAFLESGSEPISGIQVAECAIATFHTSALREYRHALARLDPPRRWAGSLRAQEFVMSLGFPEEWAGTPNSGRPPFLEVNGPYLLPPLHSYQCKIVGKVRELIRSHGMLGGRRGMISMPTGSGKTRVAVQALVESIREDGFENGILWVADRDELCEQAVESWQQVWSSQGTPTQKLRISRMWRGQPLPLPTGHMHVIVATVQTLYAKLTRQPDRYNFLSDFKILVFDEAHRSVARTSTSVMQELGLTRWRREDEPILIGLTATPYRGHDEAETQRLVRRYGRNRLDAGAFASNEPEAVIQELQTMHVLARADHKIIEGGEFSLSEEELQQSEQGPWLPQSVEDRIANDSFRTQRILHAYQEHIEADWPTLVFATSVEHSQTLAALLTARGITARAVSAKTETSVRRRIVEEFRAGTIRALVNYGIFREGFDAPKTRAIVVARPVYSPNLYFQMIGRGLRGVKNGGNDCCRILDVRDNIDNFQRRLAFSDLDWLWE